MTEGDGGGAPGRRALALHLEELRRDGVWGLPVRSGGPCRRGQGTAGADREQAPTSGEAGDGASLHQPSPAATETAATPPPAPEHGSAAAPAGRDAGADSGPGTEAIRREPDLFDAAGDALTGTDESLEEIRPEVEGCTLCRLCESRTRVVFGVGDPDADLMFIGEGPGRDEDLQGEPFVGRAGKLLDKIIAAMGRRRDDVYIANTVKCRPPRNRNPRDDELAACLPYLERQVAVIRPRMIVLLGRVAVQAVLGLDAPLSRLRGRFQTWRGADVMCTYHPAYLLRNPSAKRMVWEDMQQVMGRLDGEG